MGACGGARERERERARLLYFPWHLRTPLCPFFWMFLVYQNIPIHRGCVSRSHNIKEHIYILCSLNVYLSEKQIQEPADHYIIPRFATSNKNVTTKFMVWMWIWIRAIGYMMNIQVCCITWINEDLIDFSDASRMNDHSLQCKIFWCIKKWNDCQQKNAKKKPFQTRDESKDRVTIGFGPFKEVGHDARADVMGDGGHGKSPSISVEL